MEPSIGFNRSARRGRPDCLGARFVPNRSGGCCHGRSKLPRVSAGGALRVGTTRGPVPPLAERGRPRALPRDSEPGPAKRRVQKSNGRLGPACHSARAAPATSVPGIIPDFFSCASCISWFIRHPQNALQPASGPLLPAPLRLYPAKSGHTDFPNASDSVFGLRASFGFRGLGFRIFAAHCLFLTPNHT
jgi:hypothetical protein